MLLSIPSIDTSDQGERQQHFFPVSMPVGVRAPPLQQFITIFFALGQPYQQFSHLMPPQQQQRHMPQMWTPPSHLSLLHSHLSRPPPMAGSLPVPLMSDSPPSQMRMQGSTNQMVQPMLQGHMMMGPSGPGQMYLPLGGSYNCGEPVQMSMVPALNVHQLGNQNWTGTRQVGMHMGISPGMLPPPRPPQQQQQHGSVPQ